MPRNHREILANTRTLEQLVAYLHDEMDWPIRPDDFETLDDITFDYEPGELGIDARSAAKIKTIRRLRPLSASQPWGIFFIEFEPKQLPTVALRRILGSFVRKQRASGAAADRMQWQMDDLLFISNFGEGDGRQISFAHFSQESEKGLPTLRVLGWDNLDTPLRLDAVAETLTEKLVWPEDERDVAQWRESWSSAFTLRYKESIATAQDLSIRLAELARGIRDRIRSALAVETQSGPLTKLMDAFRLALVHDLEPESFADMYAQTIAYGLLSARIVDPKSRTADDFGAHMRTNPLLRELMKAFLEDDGSQGLDFDELGVGEVVQLLDLANMNEVLRDFGDRNPLEDPVIHFYESFLKEYDARRRMQRGVFYTPRPVVSCIVRSVDELLRSEFGLEDGLADVTTWGEMAERHKDIHVPAGVSADQDFVRILDPATGTGTFLVEVIDLIHQRMSRRWQSEGRSTEEAVESWNEYVRKHLLPRLHGFELLMAPYSIAHLKIGLKLHETGYHFNHTERARVFLTNALEEASDVGQQSLAGMLPALAEEARAVNQVKRNQGFTIVLGNPPYSKLSANLAPEHRRMVEPFRYVDGERVVERGALALEMNLQDDYVKFIRLAQMTLADTGVGVAGLITNHGYLSTPTLRGMRWNLISFYRRVFVLDLHGHSGKGERAPGGGADENVFDIQQGVAVSLCVKQPSSTPQLADVKCADLYGAREDKYSRLMRTGIADTEWSQSKPSPPNFRFGSDDADAPDEFLSWISLSDALSLTSDGIVTARDGLVVGFTESELLDRMSAFRDSEGTGREICQRFGIAPSSAGFDPDAALRALREESDLSRHVIRIQYRPFDYRFLFYFKGLIQSMRWPVTSQLSVHGNILLAVTRQVNRPKYEHTLVSRFMYEKKTVSHDRNTQVFPMLVGPGTELALDLRPHGNWSQGFCREWTDLVGTDPASEESAVAPLHYVYAILHSPTYRRRYFSFLKSEFPRIPLPRAAAAVDALSRIGRELVALHLLESPRLAEPLAVYSGGSNPEVGKAWWSDDTVWLQAASVRATTAAPCFKGVTAAVWDFRIGGYRVCEKWLKDRKGRCLSDDDIGHYQRIIAALSETLRLMDDVDDVVGEFGGWPDAFRCSDLDGA